MEKIYSADSGLDSNATSNKNDASNSTLAGDIELDESAVILEKAVQLFKIDPMNEIEVEGGTALVSIVRSRTCSTNPASSGDSSGKNIWFIQVTFT